MKETAFSSLLVVVLLLSITIPCFANDGWQSTILISSGNASSKLTFGQNAAATDRNDGFYDVPALFSGELRAAFTDGGGTLWRDIKGVDNETVKKWRLSIISNSVEVIKVSWDKENLPEDARIALVDVDAGKSIDMKVMSSYRMENSDGGELVIEVSNILN